MIGRSAPAFWALRTLMTNSQVPRSMSAMFPVDAAPFGQGLAAVVGGRRSREQHDVSGDARRVRKDRSAGARRRMLPAMLAGKFTTTG